MTIKWLGTSWFTGKFKLIDDATGTGTYIVIFSEDINTNVFKLLEKHITYR
jgi:hypothetical protein